MDRLNLLKFLFKNHAADNVDFDDLSVKTEGYVVHDIVDFYNKTLFEIYKEGKKTQKDENRFQREVSYFSCFGKCYNRQTKSL